MARFVVTTGIIFVLLSLIYEAEPTCVWASDFGFTVNCAFKKSGLFRVRNLGGVKAHFGLGFSVGDELGFADSLTNRDPSKRRSVSVNNGSPTNALGEVAVPPEKQTGKRGKQNRLIVRQPSQATPTVVVGTGRAQRPIVVMDTPAQQSNVKPSTLPPFKPLPPPKEETLTVLPMQPIQSKGPGLAYPTNQQMQISKMMSQMPNQNMQYLPTGVTAFVPMPPVKQVSFVPMKNSVQIPMGPANGFLQNSMSIGHSADQRPYPIFNENTISKADDDVNTIGYEEDPAADINEKIVAIAKAANISMEAVEAAIVLRQQQLLNQYANIPISTTPSTTTTASTTTRPTLATAKPYVPKRPSPQSSTSGKVMNAPREYYPIGYEKNFDDKFESKVELPDTSFYCGDQKYFPGLYGDEDLGCMVFHVCALTDDGLVMKSFLCPESTLFDQTILKCNWWFYVDCKATNSLYDTNIPVSKSYQLMKALTFFSNYKKELGSEEDRSGNPEDMQGVRDAISILENQDSPTTEPVSIVTSKPNTNRFSLNRQNRNRSPTNSNQILKQSSDKVITNVTSSFRIKSDSSAKSEERYQASKESLDVSSTEKTAEFNSTSSEVSSINSSEKSSENDRKRERYGTKRVRSSSTVTPKLTQRSSTSSQKTTTKSRRKYTSSAKTTSTSSTTEIPCADDETRAVVIEVNGETATRYPWSSSTKVDRSQEQTSSTRSSATFDSGNIKSTPSGEKVYVVEASPLSEFLKQDLVYSETSISNRSVSVATQA